MQSLIQAATAAAEPSGRTLHAQRVQEIDALRGIAAMAVVLFHYTTRFVELYPPAVAPSLLFGYGHYGVNLFFIISGYVIFMTLERTTRPMDFAVSRFSRLFPAYWFAIFLTFAFTHWLGLPGKTVDLGTAFGNMLMIHGLFRIPHVDGTYWTLEVELLFYCGMLLLYRMRRLHQIHLFLGAVLLLRLANFLAERWLGIGLPWTLYRLLILEYIPWFVLGISVFLINSPRHAATRGRSLGTAVGAVLVLSISGSWFLGLLSCGLAATVHLAAIGRLPMLRKPLFVWLGAISYPLYLVHENIGWSFMLQLRSMGIPIDLGILMTIAFSLALASAVTRWVEQPAMQWIRDNYRRHRAGRS
ncbi:MAG: acyltransferase [Burkholderiaceae bacterium]|nr:acyltransferase [Burkholderiaceae bacterium]